MLIFFKKRKPIDSRINGPLLVGRQYGKKAVFGGGVTQSGGELIFMWETIIGNLKKEGMDVAYFLSLGLGAGMTTHIAKKIFPKAQLTGVDMDSIIVEIGKKDFDLEKDKVKILLEDATMFVTRTNEKYDLITVDLFIGRWNAKKTRDIVFLKNLKKILRKNGVILYNSHYNEKKPAEYKTFEQLCKKYFKKVEEVFSYPLNRVLLLSN